MDAFIIDDTMKNKWEQYVDRNQSIAWQSYEWSYVVQKHYNVEFFPIVAMENSNICGILPLYLVNNFLGQPSMISVPYAVAGGIVADNKDIEACLLDKAIELFDMHRCSKMTFKQYKNKINGNLKTDENFYNRELNLAEDIDIIWNNLSEINKNRIESAKNFNLILEHPSYDLNRFYSLLLLHHQHSGIPCVSRKWIKDLIDFKMYSIALLMKKNNTIVAGTMVKEHKKTVSFPFTCIPDTTDQSNMFVYYLYWMLIKKFANDGKEIFHSGRIPNTDLTNEYRLGWAGKKYKYYYQYYPNDTRETEYSTKRGRKREIFTTVWRKLPMGLVRIIGPYIVRNFP